jgi:hypothetical protein
MKRSDSRVVAAQPSAIRTVEGLQRALQGLHPTREKLPG